MVGGSLAVAKSPVIVRLLTGSSKVSELPLSPGAQETHVTVGSGEFCKWQVEGDGIAPLHFELYWDGSTLWISDPESVGVQVNKRNVSGWQQLCGKLRIEFGSGAVEVEGPGPPELGWDSEKTAGGPIQANVMKFMSRGGQKRETESDEREERAAPKPWQHADDSDEYEDAPRGARVDDHDEPAEEKRSFATEGRSTDTVAAKRLGQLRSEAVNASVSRPVRRADRETQLTSYPDEPEYPERTELGVKEHWFAAAPEQEPAPVSSSGQPETAPHPVAPPPRESITAPHQVGPATGASDPRSAWSSEQHAAHEPPSPRLAPGPETSSPWAWQREEHVMGTTATIEDNARWFEQEAPGAWPAEAAPEVSRIGPGAAGAMPWVIAEDAWARAPQAEWPEDPVEAGRSRGETDEVPLPFSAAENPDPWESLVGSGRAPTPIPEYVPSPNPSFPPSQAPSFSASAPVNAPSWQELPQSAAAENTEPDERQAEQTPPDTLTGGTNAAPFSFPLPQSALPTPEPDLPAQRPLPQPTPSSPSWAEAAPPAQAPPVAVASGDGRFVLPPRTDAPKRAPPDMQKIRMWLLCGGIAVVALLVVFSSSRSKSPEVSGGQGTHIRWDPTPDGTILTPPEPTRPALSLSAIQPAKNATPQSAAADLFAGRHIEALKKYQRLRRQHPGNRAYANTAEILLRSVTERCASEDARRDPDCAELLDRD